MESFFSPLKTERIAHKTDWTRNQAKALDARPAQPIDFEQRARAA